MCVHLDIHVLGIILCVIRAVEMTCITSCASSGSLRKQEGVLYTSVIGNTSQLKGSRSPV